MKTPGDDRLMPAGERTCGDLRGLEGKYELKGQVKNVMVKPVPDSSAARAPD